MAKLKFETFVFPVSDFKLWRISAKCLRCDKDVEVAAQGDSVSGETLTELLKEHRESCKAK